MEYVTSDRPDDPPIPDYKWVPGVPDEYSRVNGCTGCDFRPLSTSIRSSRIPCQRHPWMVAQTIDPTNTKAEHESN